jgi:hypothetical protein
MGSQLNEAGTPDPLDFRRHRPVGGVFKDGAVLSNTVPTVIMVPIAGANGYRLRGKITTTEAAPPSPMGVLSFAYLRPPPHSATAYSTALYPPAADQAVVKGTEFVVNIPPIGESLLRITFTPDGGVDVAKAISVVWLDQGQV